jgi:hypothetical protein
MSTHEASEHLVPLPEGVGTQPEQAPSPVQDAAAPDILTAEEAMALGERESLENFSDFFAPADSAIGPVKHQMKCRQRFALKYPDETKWLETIVGMGATTNTPLMGVNPQFVKAYERMRELVDKSDETVLDADGNVNPRFLLQ